MVQLNFRGAPLRLGQRLGPGQSQPIVVHLTGQDFRQRDHLRFQEAHRKNRFEIQMSQAKNPVVRV
jgi:hypothetical protein